METGEETRTGRSGEWQVTPSALACDGGAHMAQDSNVGWRTGMKGGREEQGPTPRIFFRAPTPSKLEGQKEAWDRDGEKEPQPRRLGVKLELPCARLEPDGRARISLLYYYFVPQRWPSSASVL